MPRALKIDHRFCTCFPCSLRSYYTPRAADAQPRVWPRPGLDSAAALWYGAGKRTRCGPARPQRAGEGAQRVRVEIPRPLRRLQAALDAPLYLVGGAVRNALLGLPPGDLDAAGPLPPEAAASRCGFAGLSAAPRGPATRGAAIASVAASTSVPRVLHGAHDGGARDGGAGHGVNVEALGLNDALGHDGHGGACPHSDFL